jgi:hypothetical protein
MAQTSYSNPQWARVGVDTVVEQFNRDVPTLWKDMVDTVPTNNQLFQRFGTFQTLPVAGVTGELEGITTGDFLSSYTKDVYNYKRAIEVILSNEAIDRDRALKKVFADIPWHIMNSIHYSQEYDCANLINLATTITTPDGTAFASNAHPVLTGTDSNYTTGAFSIGVLETGIQTIRQQKNQNGDPYIPNMSGYTLWCHPSSEMLVRRIAEAAGYPDTITTGRYNDPNLAGQFITGVRANPFFTNTTAVIMLPTKMKQNPLKVAIQRPTSVKVNDLPHVDGVQTLGTSIWLSVATDYRNTMYFTGS